MGFLKRRERKHFQIFLVFFSPIFLFFLPNISSKLIFYKTIGLYLQGYKKNGRLCVGVLTPKQTISSFSWFMVWSSSDCLEAFSSSVFFKHYTLKNSRCLVSIGSEFERFWATIIEILSLERRWCSVGDSVMFFLKKCIPSNLW